MKMRFADVLKIMNGRNQRHVENQKGIYPIYGSGGVMGYADDYICAEHTVIIGRKGSINNPLFVDEKCWNVDTAFGLVANNHIIMPKYLYYFCKKYDFNKLNTTVTIPSLTKANLLNIEIEIPSLKEQSRIVDILDKIQSIISIQRKRLDQIAQLTKSQFIEMFGDPVKNPMGWDIRPLGECGSLKNGMNYSQKDSGYNVRCMGVGDFGTLYRINDVQCIAKISLSMWPAPDYFLQDGDIVFVRSNGNKALVGRSVEIFPGEEELIFSGFCIRYRNNTPKLLTIFLNHALHLPTMKATLLSNGRGANIQNVNQQALSDLKIPIPPLPLQNRFADFVRQADKSKFTMQCQFNEAEAAKNALMQKFFG